MVDKLVTEYAWQGPKRGVDRAVLLAHGAGSDMNGAALIAVADALADVGVPSLRFNYPYRSSGKKAPDRAEGARRRDPRGRGRTGAPRQAPAGAARARRTFDGRSVLLARRGRGRRSRARARTAAPRLSPARRGQGRPTACRALRPAARAGVVRERDPRLDGGTRRPHESRAPDQGEGVVPLDRQRRPRVPAAEVQRSHRRPRCSRRWPR